VTLYRRLALAPMLYPVIPSAKTLIVVGIPMAGFAKSAFESNNAETIAARRSMNVAHTMGSENVKPMK